jgi:hypothetical protein
MDFTYGTDATGVYLPRNEMIEFQKKKGMPLFRFTQVHRYVKPEKLSRITNWR